MKPPIRNYFVYYMVREGFSTFHNIKLAFRRMSVPVNPDGIRRSLQHLSTHELVLVKPPRRAIEMHGKPDEFKTYNYWSGEFPARFLTPSNLTYKAVEMEWDDAFLRCTSDQYYLSYMIHADEPLREDLLEWARKDVHSLERATWSIIEKIRSNEISLEGLILKLTKS